MKQVRVTAVNGRKVQANGKWLTAIGNNSVAVGDLVWTDGKCVYGHQSAVGGNSAVIVSKTHPTIPVILGRQGLYTYDKDLQKIKSAKSPGYRVVWNDKHEIYAWKYDSSVPSFTIAANKVNGVLYEIKGFYSFDSLRGGGNHYYVVGIYAGGKLIRSIDFSAHVSMDEGISEGLYATIPAEPKSAYDIPTKTWGGVCEWGFIEDADHWAFMTAVGCSQGRLKGSCMAASVYYYTPEGEILLGSTSGVMKGMYAPEKSYYDGGFSGIRFPCQDGYYYTVSPIPDVSWAIYLPSISWVTLYAPNGDVVFSDYSIVGRHYSVYRLGESKYLLGIDDRSIFIASMSTTVGWDPNYKDPDWIRAGLYIVEDGILEPLMVEHNTIHCRNQRFAKYNKSDKWTENIKEM